MSRWESLEEYEHDDLSRDITNLTAKLTEISLRKEKKRSVVKELKDLRSLVTGLKEMLLEAGQRPKPSAKLISSPLLTASTRIITRLLFLHVQKGLEIGYNEQFTITIRSMVGTLRTSLEMNSVHSHAEPPKVWQPEDGDEPQTSAWDVVDRIDWMEEPLPSRNMTDPEEYKVDLEALNMPVLQWPGMYIPPKSPSMSMIELKWRGGETSKEIDGSDQGPEHGSEDGLGKGGSRKSCFSEDQEISEAREEIEETTRSKDANYFLDSAEVPSMRGADQADFLKDEEADEDMEDIHEVEDASSVLGSAEESSAEVSSEKGSDKAGLAEDEEADEDMEDIPEVRPLTEDDYIA